MRLGKKMPPYPIINKVAHMSSYKNSNFEFTYQLEELAEVLLLKDVKITTNHSELLSYLADQKLQGVLVVECSTTIYRKLFSISLEPQNISIPISDLSGKVEISCFVYATENIENYTSNDMKDEYLGYRFSIEKYSIFAVDDGISVKIEHDSKKDNKVSSIFTIIPSLDPDFSVMRVDLYEKKIQITLPSKAFEYYDALKDKISFQDIYFSMIAIPALTSAFSELQKWPNTTEVEEIIDKYSWFRSIVARYQKLKNIALDFETFKQSNSLELAQELMNNCTTKAFGAFYNAVTDIRPSDMEDENYD